MDLLERERERSTLSAALSESLESGRVALVLGEAGIGKTALVASMTQQLEPRRVLWGACDPLITPRPLGPLRDVAREAGGRLAAVIDRGREQVLHAALDELADQAVLVIEDLHWADDATLDLVALLGRRLVRSPGCLIITSRSEALPEVRRVLSALPRECLRRIEPDPLSAGAVAQLAREAGRDAADLHAVTGGNPFFVTEALATPAGELPASVRDAVAFRISTLDDAAREVVELCAVVPGATELELISSGAAAIDACIDAGLLLLRGETLAFRHDLARLAVEEAISPVRRRELDRKVLDALERSGDADLARLVHHARRAGDTQAIRRLAPEAARAASAARGHRQALAHWEAALDAAGGDDLEALEGITNEAYCAAASTRPWRPPARCSPTTSAIRSSRATPCAGCRACCGGRARGRRRAGPATRQSRCSRTSPRAASWRWRSAPARSWRCSARTRGSRSSSDAGGDAGAQARRRRDHLARPDEPRDGDVLRRSRTASAGAR